MTLSGICVVIFCIVLHRTQANIKFDHEDPSKNLVPNWSLELPFGDETYATKGRVQQSTDAHTGSYSYKVYDRENAGGGIYHRIQFADGLKKNTNYYLSFFVKLHTNSALEPYIKVRAFYRIYYDNKDYESDFCGTLPYERAENAWKYIGGDFKTPPAAFKFMDIHLRVEPMDVVFSVDSVSLTEIPFIRRFRGYIREKIRKNRMSDVTIRFNLGSEFQSGVTKIRVTHKKHDFLFGTSIPGLAFIRNTTYYTNYRNFILNNFNWIGFDSDLNWFDIERVKGDIKFEIPDRVIWMAQHYGLKVRGHAIVWNRPQNTPFWARDLTGWPLRREINRRVDYIVGHYKGKLNEWEVSNEQVHHRFYEEKIGDKDLLYKLFQRARAIDPDVDLYLNDYEFVRTGDKTAAAVEMVRWLQRHGADVNGIGVQSHLRVIPIEPQVLEKRVQVLGLSGLWVSITELSVHSLDEDIKATQMEQALSIYFSEPCVKGVMLWKFSDEPTLMFERDAALTNGPNFIPNKAGRIMLDLINRQWKTNLKFWAPSRIFPRTFRGYHGTYSITVHNGRRLIHQQEMVVTNNTNNVVDVTIP